MRRIFFLLILGLSRLSTSAQQQQFPSDFWNDGKVVLDHGDTLKGQIKYSMQNDLLQLETRGHLETFTPRKAVFAEIFDKNYKRFRQFYSLPYANGGQYKAPMFFELLEEGKWTLLGRESLEYKTYSSNYYYGSYTRLVLVEKFFFLKDDGSITPFTGNKKDLFELMGTKGDDVKKYVRENRINFDTKYGFAEIVRYYNSLFK